MAIDDDADFSHPTTAVERAADEAMIALELALQREGLELRHCLFMLSISNAPSGETDTTTAGAGFDSTHEMVRIALAHLSSVMAAVGFDGGAQNN